MPEKAIIFDLDGTLIHSAPDLHVAINHALERINRPMLDLAQVISFIGNGVEKLVERSLDATGERTADLCRDTLDHFMAYYDDHTTTLTRPYDGVVTCLQTLRSAGIKLSVCTNKPSGPARNICDALELSAFFKVIAGAEEGQPKKPDPMPLLRCIKALEVRKEDTLYVGDSVVDYQTAKNAGVPFRLFSGGYLNAPLPDLPTADRFDDWSHSGLLLDA